MNHRGPFAAAVAWGALTVVIAFIVGYLAGGVVYEVGGGRSLSSVVKFLSEWQTFVAGGLAFIGAWWTVKVLRAQLMHAERQTSALRRRALDVEHDAMVQLIMTCRETRAWMEQLLAANLGQLASAELAKSRPVHELKQEGLLARNALANLERLGVDLGVARQSTTRSPKLTAAIGDAQQRLIVLRVNIFVWGLGSDNPDRNHALQVSRELADKAQLFFDTLDEIEQTSAKLMVAISADIKALDAATLET